MTAQMHLDMYTAMGFVATPLGYSEVYNAMQTGVVDGFEDTACSTITSGTYETAKYVVKSGHATASPLFVCSGITWDGLSQEEKDWLTEAVEKGRQACYDTFETAQENAYKTFEEKGLQVFYMHFPAQMCIRDSAFSSSSSFKSVTEQPAISSDVI